MSTRNLRCPEVHPIEGFRCEQYFDLEAAMDFPGHTHQVVAPDGRHSWWWTDKWANDYRRENAPLSFQEFRRANEGRAPHFPSACRNWILAQWGNAVAGEVGEACNIIKKIDRGDFTIEEARESLADELADAIHYLDHLARHAGIDLGAAVIRKFNVVSERRGLPHRL